jgi:hypothetical protein
VRAKAYSRIAKESGKPTVVIMNNEVILPAANEDAAEINAGMAQVRAELTANGVPVFRSSAIAARAYLRVLEYSRYRKSLKEVALV